MKFKDYQFGFADATKEFTRVPEIFEKAFCDPRNIVQQLLDGYQFLLVGRKGVGKSAYSSKIQSIARNSEDLYAFPLQLNDFEFSTFAKTSIDSDVAGTQKYKASWDFLLLLTIYKVLVKDLRMTETDQVNRVVDLLNKLGFSLDAGYKSDITKLSRIKVGAGIVEFDAEFEKELNVKPLSYLERLTTLIEIMLNNLSDIYLNDRKLYIVIDGLDDILRYKKNKLEIIASLVRSADYLNDKMSQYTQNIKIILLIREDIISSVVDPDLNKIIQDSSIFINWNNRLDDLKELIELRFKLSGIPEEEASELWNSLFPRKIKNKLNWEYILEYTLFKPRDVLQFFKWCQNEYPERTGLSLSETQNVIKMYSNKYFIEEMKNELSGFVSDEIINILPSAFRKLGNRSFTLSELTTILEEQCADEKIAQTDVKYLLLMLFDAGYIGQIVSSGKGRKESVVFKYRNPTARIDYQQKFITHKGLHSGLGIRL